MLKVYNLLVKRVTNKTLMCLLYSRGSKLIIANKMKGVFKIM